MADVAEILAPSRAISVLKHVTYDLLQQPGALYVRMPSGETGLTPWAMDAQTMLATANAEIVLEFLQEIREDAGPVVGPAVSRLKRG